MDYISKIKKLSLIVFIVPTLAINICLFIVIYIDLPIGSNIGPTFPYIDGGTSISRTARIFPTYLIFKPAMFLTSYLLIKYWVYNKNIILSLDNDNNNVKKIFFFGVGSAILLTIHSIFLGIKFDYDLYKLFRRVVMLLFIIFEIIAQAYLVITLYKLKDKIIDKINFKFLKLKGILVSLLIIVAILAIPIVSMPGNKFFKHALEWDYFVGVISFYLLTYFMWKKKY